MTAPTETPAPTLLALEMLGQFEIMSARRQDGDKGIILRFTTEDQDGENNTFVIGVDIAMAGDIAMELAETVEAIREGRGMWTEH